MSVRHLLWLFAFSVYLSSPCRLGHVFSPSYPSLSALLASLPVGVSSLCRPAGALHRPGRPKLPRRRAAGWLLLSRRFGSSRAAVFRAVRFLSPAWVWLSLSLLAVPGSWGEAAGMVLPQGGCSARGRYVRRLHLGASVSSPFPRDPTNHILIPCHALCVAASANKGGETRRVDDPNPDWPPRSCLLCGSQTGRHA